MVALHVTFYLIICLFAMVALLIVFGPSIAELTAYQQVFGKGETLEGLDLRDPNVDCRVSEGKIELAFSAQMARPVVKKVTEILPVFIFRGAVFPREGGKMTVKPEDTQTTPIESKFFVNALPKKDEMVSVAFLGDDSRCSSLAAGRPAVEKFSQECGNLVKFIKSFQLKAGSCFSGFEDTRMIRLDNIGTLSGNMCRVDFTVKNTYNSPWTPADGIMPMIDCIGSEFIGIGDIFVLPAGGSRSGHVFCPRWNEADLKKANLLDKYKDGWKIILFKQCSEDPTIRCAAGRELTSITFKC